MHLDGIRFSCCSTTNYKQIDFYLKRGHVIDSGRRRRSPRHIRQAFDSIGEWSNAILTESLQIASFLMIWKSCLSLFLFVEEEGDFNLPASLSTTTTSPGSTNQHNIRCANICLWWTRSDEKIVSVVVHHTSQTASCAHAHIGFLLATSHHIHISG